MKYQVFTLSTKGIKSEQSFSEDCTLVKEGIGRFITGVMYGLFYAGKKHWGVIVIKIEGDICRIIDTRDFFDKHMGVFIRDYIIPNNLTLKGSKS